MDVLSQKRWIKVVRISKDSPSLTFYDEDKGRMVRVVRCSLTSCCRRSLSPVLQICMSAREAARKVTPVHITCYVNNIQLLCSLSVNRLSRAIVIIISQSEKYSLLYSRPTLVISLQRHVCCQLVRQKIVVNVVVVVVAVDVVDVLFKAKIQDHGESL